MFNKTPQTKQFLIKRTTVKGELYDFFAIVGVFLSPTTLAQKEGSRLWWKKAAKSSVRKNNNRSNDGRVTGNRNGDNRNSDNLSGGLRNNNPANRNFEVRF
ncbi:MAG: hypothetical protein ACOVO1_03335 [Chitinophagaceae bacterium]